MVKIQDESGSFDESGAAYLYQYQYVTNINKIDDFYVIAEIYRGADGTVTRTGNLFAVNAYTRELWKLADGRERPPLYTGDCFSYINSINPNRRDGKEKCIRS